MMSQMPNSEAGSDTPEQIEQEVQQELAEALQGRSIEQFLDQAASSDDALAPAPGTEDADPAQIDPASVHPAPQQRDADPNRSKVAFHFVRGRIASVEGDDVFVTLHGEAGKNQGVVPLTQFDRPPRPGSIMDFVVERHDEAEGLVILSREGAVSRETWENLQRGSVVEARVIGTNKGGLELELVGRIRAFMPASQVDLHHIDDLEPFVGQAVRAMVHDINRGKKSIVLSRRNYLAAEKEAQRKRVWETLAPEQTVEGTVSSVMDYGAFVDIGGIDGLVHVSQMSYQRVTKPKDVVSVGDKVTVKILSLDPENNRVSLSLKQVAPDPWDGITDRLKVGEQVTGRVARTADFGAFVELETGVEGLVPVGEMSWRHINRPSDVVKDGDVVRLIVTEIDTGKRRLTFSLKQTQPDPWGEIAQKFPKGAVADGVILRTTDFGAFAQLAEGVEGLIHISELSNRRVNRVEDVVQAGQTHKVRVLEVDGENRRIRLSIKAVDHPPEDAADPAAAERAAAAAKRRKPTKPLKGGMGTSGALGMGLGDLKL